MMNAVVLFESAAFGRLRTVGTADDPKFCLKDVCKALGLTPKLVNQRLTKEVVSNYPLETAGGTQKALFVNEDGLYDVILDSRKPEAKAFRKWITSEVLPSIRKTGGYLAGGAEMSDEEIMAKALRVAEATIARKAEELKALQRDNEKLKEASDYVASILTAKETLTVTQIAQDYGTTANRLNVWLSDMGIQRKVNGQWVLRAPYLGQGYVKSEQITYRHSDGRIGTKLNTRWTNAGRLFLYKALKEHAILPMIERERH